MGFRFSLLIVVVTAGVIFCFNRKSDEAFAVTTPSGYTAPTTIKNKSWEDNIPAKEVDALKAPESQAVANVEDTTADKTSTVTTASAPSKQGIARRRHRRHRRHHRRW